MKLKICLLLLMCVGHVDIFAQMPKSIEADLLTSFKRIDYWNEKIHNDTTNKIIAEDDSLDMANELFAKKLKHYAEKYPATIEQDFALLKKEYLSISTSNDGLFRIYSWDTQGGGTERSFLNVFQYKLGKKTLAVINSSKDFNPAYTKILTVTCNGRQCYAVNLLIIESSRYYNEGIQIFTVENGKLNDHLKLIKTQSGLHNEINYEYDLASVADMNKIPAIVFDQALKTIKMPIVDIKGRFTKGFITYQFTGKYFEKVKP